MIGTTLAHYEITALLGKGGMGEVYRARDTRLDRREVETGAPTSAASPVTGPAVAESPSIAVLAFANMSSDQEQEYFSDGIAEELLNLLAKIPELKVISRTSAFSYKGKDVPLKQVARELGVAHILEGSVRKAGNRLRISTQLIDARSDTHLWSETYDRTLEDIFAIQDEIAGDVVEHLEVTLLGRVPKAEKVDPEAYALYLQARHARLLGSAEGNERAVELLQQVLAIAPDYAAAWITLSTVYFNQAGRPGYPADERYALARKAVQKALAIDPHFANAHAGLGWLAMFGDGRLPGHMAGLHAFLGDVDASFQWMERTLAEQGSTDIDPFSPLLDSLRDDPRWLPLLERAGKAPEQLAAIEFEVTLPRASR